MSKSQAQTMDHKHLMEEREKYNAKLKNWKTREENHHYDAEFAALMEEVDEVEKKTCLQLQNIFHMAMLMGILPHLKTREKMMNYLNTSGDPDWTASYIWSLADSNKIDWVKGYGDPTPYETYKADMNRALAKYVCPDN